MIWWIIATVDDDDDDDDDVGLRSKLCHRGSG